MSKNSMNTGSIYTRVDHKDDHTVVSHEDESLQEYGAPNRFQVTSVPDEDTGAVKVLTYVDFQAGPIKECGVNGVSNEDLIAMVLTRLESFQNTKFKCKENEMAITKLKESLMWLKKRTLGREKRGVEGTNKD